MRRGRVVAGVVSFAAVVAVGLPLLPHRPTPCRGTFESVRAGMTFEEVCATVGRPPGDYSDGGCVHSGYRMTGDRVGWWLADDGELIVLFDMGGRAASVWAGPAARYPAPSLWARLRARLGL